MELLIRITVIVVWGAILFFFLPKSCDQQDKIDQAQTLKHKTYVSPSDQLANKKGENHE